MPGVINAFFLDLLRNFVPWLLVLVFSGRRIGPQQLQLQVRTLANFQRRGSVNRRKGECKIYSLPDELIAKIIRTACDPTTNPTQHQIFASVSRRFRYITLDQSELWTHMYVGQSLDWLWHQVRLSKNRGLVINFTRIEDVGPNAPNGRTTHAGWCANEMEPGDRCACLEFLIFVTEYNYRWEKFVYRIYHSSAYAQERMHSLLNSLWLPRLTHLEMFPPVITGRAFSRDFFFQTWIMKELRSMVCTEGMRHSYLLFEMPPHLQALGICSSFSTAKLHDFRDLLHRASSSPNSIKTLSLNFDGRPMRTNDDNLPIPGGLRPFNFTSVRILSVHIHPQSTQQPFFAVLPLLQLPNLEAVFVKFDLLSPELSCFTPFIEFGRWMSQLPTTRFRDLVVVVNKGSAISDEVVGVVMVEILESVGRMRRTGNWYGRAWSQDNNPFRFERLIRDIDGAGFDLSISHEELVRCVSFRSSPGVPVVHLAFQA